MKKGTGLVTAECDGVPVHTLNVYEGSGVITPLVFYLGMTPSSLRKEPSVEHDVSSITTADAHTSAASSRLN